MCWCCHCCRRGPAQGGENLTNRVAFCQTALAVPIAVGPSIHGLPDQRGTIELAGRYRTSYGRPPEHNVDAVEVYRKVRNWRTERRPSPSMDKSSHRSRDQRTSMEPFIVPAFEPTCVRSPAILTARSVMPDLPSGCRLVCARRVLCS